MKQSFSALGVSAAVEQALAVRGIVEPFYIQSLVLPDALAGRDVLAKSPTGSGKTLAFGVPLVERVDVDGATPEALVLVPTRELALQVADEIASYSSAKGVKVALAYGGAPVGPQAKRLQGAHIVVATPGRLQDLIERRLVKLGGIRILVLDEADRMLDMGFRPQVERILRSVPRERQTMLFSATLDGEIDTLVELLEAEEGLSLVFVRTKRGADRLAQKLSRRGVDVVAMHGDMGQSQRERALENFRSGRATTLIATDVAARGLDLEAIGHVINFDPPEDNIGYTHRVGRTGRAGRSGRGSTLVLPDQQADVSRVAMLAGHKEQFERTGMRSARPKLVYTSRRGRRSRW